MSATTDRTAGSMQGHGRGRTAMILAALIMAEMVSAFGASLFYGGIAKILSAFQNPLAIGWMLTAFYLMQAVLGALGGRLGDMYGRRNVLLIMLALSGVGSFVGGLSTGVTGVIIGRAVQGCVGAILPLCLGLVRENFSPEKTRVGTGVLVACAGVLGGGGGLLLGGALVDWYSWHAIFLFVGAIAVVAFAAVALIVPVGVAEGRVARIDLLGGILFVPAVGGALLALNMTRSTGWLAPQFLILFAGSLLLLAVWVWHERRIGEPLINVRLFAQREILLANMATICVAMGTYQYAQVFMQLLQQPAATGIGYGLSATRAGMLMFPPLLLAFAAGPLSAKLSAGTGARRPLFLGAMMLVAVWSVLALATVGLPILFALLCLQGLGMIMMVAAINILLVDAAPNARTSEVLGLNAVVRATAQGIGSQMIAMLFAGSAAVATAHAMMPSAAGYAAVFAYMAIVALVSAVVALNVRRGVHSPGD